MNTPINTKDISIKNTKNEILEAYESLRAQARELYKKNRQQQQTLENQQRIVASAGEQSTNDVQQHLRDLRQQVNDQIDAMGAQLQAESKRLETIQQAIQLEETRLKEMYEITKETHTLETLLLAHQQETAQFEQHMADKKNQWEHEQKKALQAIQEEQECTKKAWQREQEEYHYKTKLVREKDQDEYDAKKAKEELALKQQKEQLNAAFSEREEKLSAQEERFHELEQRVAEFPEKLASALTERETIVQERLNREHQFQFDLLSKEREGEQQLNQQTIASLELKIKSQEQLIAQLSEKANVSAAQVQDIALKAIEGASGAKNIYYPSEVVKKTDSE